MIFIVSSTSRTVRQRSARLLVQSFGLVALFGVLCGLCLCLPTQRPLLLSLLLGVSPIVAVRFVQLLAEVGVSQEFRRARFLALGGLLVCFVSGEWLWHERPWWLLVQLVFLFFCFIGAFRFRLRPNFLLVCSLFMAYFVAY